MKSTKLSGQQWHLHLKSLTSKQICDLYQENPFDEEVDLQLWLSASWHYWQLCDFNIPLSELI